MATISASIKINRPAEEIFAFVTDVNNAVKWQSGIISAKETSDGPTGVGTTYRYAVKVMGRDLETRGEITAYNPPIKHSWKATSGPFPMSGGNTFEAGPDGVSVTSFINAEPGGFFKLAEPLLIKQQKRQMEQDLSRLKELLES
jgi:uncharacterized membrane protein